MDRSSSYADSDFAEGDDFVHESHKSEHAFRTISEVSTEIDVPQHVLRFWESKFSQIRPLKRGGGRRYYRPEDVELIRRIKNYLYHQGYTIKGVQRLLKDKKGEALVAATPSFVPYANVEASLPPLPTTPILTQASMLHAAAASPSALAMAYGAIAAQVQEGSANIKAARFPDAFAEATSHIPAEAGTAAQGQLAQSLEAVTKIYEDIAADVKPIRITNPAAPSLADMPEAREPELDLSPPEEETVQAALEQAAEQSVVQEPEQTEPAEPAIDTEGLLEVTEAVIGRDEYSPAAKQELLAILEELSALRAYMQEALSA